MYYPTSNVHYFPVALYYLLEMAILMVLMAMKGLKVYY